MLQALPTLISLGANLLSKKGPSMAERKEMLQPWRTSLDSMKDRSEQYRDRGSEFWTQQQDYITNQALQGSDWSKMFSNRQFGGMNLPSPFQAQKNLNIGQKSIQGIPGMLNKAWMNLQGESDKMFSEYAAGEQKYGDYMTGFQTEEYANKQSRLGDFTSLMGTLQGSDAWSNMFTKKEN